MENNELGKLLKKLRKSYGYTQEFAASKLDISRQAYSHYENGRALPPNDTFYKMSDLYNVSPESLIQLSLQSNTPVYNNPSGDDSVELNDFLSYINDDNNKERLRNLSYKEKQVLYYFNTIPLSEQNEIIEILKIKNRKAK